MNKQILRLKEKSIQFSMELVQKRFSDTLLEDIVEIDKKFANDSILFKRIESSKDIEALKNFIRLKEKRLPKDLIEECKKELKEIQSDIKWEKSEEGKQVLKLEEWILNVRDLLKIKGFKTIFIGRDFFDPLKLIVSGVAENSLQIERLKNIIGDLNPPTEPKYIIELPDEQ